MTGLSRYACLPRRSSMTQANTLHCKNSTALHRTARHPKSRMHCHPPTRCGPSLMAFPCTPQPSAPPLARALPVERCRARGATKCLENNHRRLRERSLDSPRHCQACCWSNHAVHDPALVPLRSCQATHPWSTVTPSCLTACCHLYQSDNVLRWTSIMPSLAPSSVEALHGLRHRVPLGPCSVIADVLCWDMPQPTPSTPAYIEPSLVPKVL